MSCEKTVRPEFTRHCFTLPTGGKRSIQPLSNSNRSGFSHALSAYLQQVRSTAQNLAGH
jgi:hypothetical protein